jgi:hypothetical protein
MTKTLHFKEAVMSFIVQYRLYLLIAAFVGLFFLPPKYKKKKSVITLMVVLGFSAGYEAIMREPVTRMPGRVHQYLTQEGPSQSENVRYYKDPDANM